jgi:hypothetical protein
MGHVPEDSKWYLAEIIEEITVAGDPRNVVHRNTVLIRADSSDEAYENAVEAGKHSEAIYKNADGKEVRFTFRGLGGLWVIHDELTHGAEIMWSEHVGVSPEQIDKWIAPKEELAVFKPEVWQPPLAGEKPDYASGEIVREIRKMMKSTHSSPKRKKAIIQ